MFLYASENIFTAVTAEVAAVSSLEFQVTEAYSSTIKGADTPAQSQWVHEWVGASKPLTGAAHYSIYLFYQENPMRFKIFHNWPAQLHKNKRVQQQLT